MSYYLFQNQGFMIKNAEMLDQAIKNRNTDQTIAALMGGPDGKVRVTIPKTKPSDIVVGKKFWNYNGDKMKWELIKITYVRSGTAFYTVGRSKKEEDFYIDSPWCARLDPEHFVSNLNPEYNIIVSRSGKTKITYKK